MDVELEVGIPSPQKKKATHFESPSFCGGSRIRTGDPMLAKHVLYQLSYTPEKSRIFSGYSGRPWQS